MNFNHNYPSKNLFQENSDRTLWQNRYTNNNYSIFDFAEKKMNKSLSCFRGR